MPGMTVLLGRLALLLALGSAVAAILAGFGSRAGWWHFRTGFQILTWAAYGGLSSAILGFIGGLAALWRGQRRGALLAFVGLVVGLLVVGLPWNMKRTAQQVPPIHDITTDTEEPPRFVAILPLRKDAPNSAEHEGAVIAAQQQAAYADLRPLLLNVPVDQAFSKALAAARDMGWEIVEAKPAEGRIEATDTTFWFGFKDDVVVRVKPADQGSRIDVRSVSRVGKSDVGTNARRIRAYLERMTH
ncbi:MAG: DUF1499 domain-containing protein [Nitrospiraceae bacterium]